MNFQTMQDQMYWPSQYQIPQWNMLQVDPVTHRRSASTVSFVQEYYAQTLCPNNALDYSAFAAQAHSVPNLQRAHTAPNINSWYHDYHVQAYRDDGLSSVPYSGEETNTFDDVASCLSESPSSYISSEYSESPFDSISPVSRNPSVFSLSNTEVQKGPTEVDALMKTLQPTPATTRTPVATTSSKSKRHLCPHTDCSKAFSQPTHLKIHLRSHTGEKPYTCSVPSCGQSFSQLGNLRTHERRHVGQRPNRRRATSEPSCGAKTKTYVCKLDGCRRQSGDSDTDGKIFTQLGNLKAHMNKFHKETLLKLSERFSSPPTSHYYDTGHDGMTREERDELRSYFQELYKNSNKGIKGRGKGRKVELLLL